MRFSNKEITRKNIKIKARLGDGTIKSRNRTNTATRKKGIGYGNANL